MRKHTHTTHAHACMHTQTHTTHTQAHTEHTHTTHTCTYMHARICTRVHTTHTHTCLSHTQRHVHGTHAHTRMHTRTHMLVLSGSSVETLDIVAMRVPGSASFVSNNNGLLVTAECQVNAADRYGANNNALEPCGVTPQDTCVCTHVHVHPYIYAQLHTRASLHSLSYTYACAHICTPAPL